jgi:hypothetical protein
MIEKSPNPPQTNVLFVKKNTQIREQKASNSLSFGNDHRVQRCMHSLFSVWRNPVNSSCVMQTVHQTRYCWFDRHRGIGKSIPKVILSGWVRSRRQAVFDNDDSLHLWKRHPCTSTVWRKLTDWHEQFTTWRDLRGPLYSHSDIVSLLTQSNCTKFQPSTNILIWVAWLFNRPVIGN